MRRILYIILSVSLILFSCDLKKPPVTDQRMLLGTVINVSVFDRGTANDVEALIDSSFSYIEDFDRLWSSTLPESDIFKLNKNSGQVSQEIDAHTFRLLTEGSMIGELTNCTFSIYLGPVTDLWGFQTGNPHIPDSSAIDDALKLTGESIFFTDKSCLLGKKGMKLDIGGIGKGYIVDLAVEYLIRDGVKSGIIEAGGDLRTFGKPTDEESWRIGIRHPRNLSEFYGVFETGECAIATSGDYQQYFEEDGVRYYHILDPKTGRPANKCVSATVAAKTCMDADAAATAVFVMGHEEGLKWLNENSDYEGIIIFFDDNQELKHVFSGGIEFDEMNGVFTLDRRF